MLLHRVLGRRLKRPAPLNLVRSIRAVFVSVTATGNLPIPEFLLGVGASCLEPGHAVYSVDSQSKAVYLVLDRQFERGIDVASLLITAHVHVLVIIPVVAEPMDQPGITVEIEDDWLVAGKETVEITIAQTMWMFPVGLHLEQVDDIGDASNAKSTLNGREDTGRNDRLDE